MTDSIPLATGDIDSIERLYESSDHVYLTCPERSNDCPWQFGPDRPDDYDLVFLLDCPYCPGCGCSLVIVSRGDYDGPEDEHHNLDIKGSPMV